MIAKHTTQFLICCWVAIAGICGLLLYTAIRPACVGDELLGCGNKLEDYTAAKNALLADGKAVFQGNCATCHNPVKDATGPALADIRSYRSPEWICRFLTQPKFIPGDKRAINLRKQYGLSCMKFPQLNCNDIEQAVDFLAYYKR